MPRNKKRSTPIRSSIGWLFSRVARPYIEAPKAIGRLPKAVRKLSDAISGINEPDEHVQWDESPDGRTAFEALYAANGWTPDQLKQQRRAVVRTKFVSLVISVLSFVWTLGGIALLDKDNYWSLVGVVIGFVVSLLAAARGGQFAIYQAQIDLRDLITAKQFLQRRDMFLRIFAS